MVFSGSKLKKSCSMSHWVEEHTNWTRQVQVRMTKKQLKSPKKTVSTQQPSKVGDMEMTQSRQRKIPKNLQNLRILPELGMFHFSLEKRIYFRMVPKLILEARSLIGRNLLSSNPCNLFERSFLVQVWMFSLDSSFLVFFWNKALKQEKVLYL